ncbi:hypothetical protein GCM10011384_04370 [Psychrobacillus lasiicapitis]|nr:hypothetical protein GCM10011384_04370 [Psychrobacillus lasiicapitis]
MGKSQDWVAESQDRNDESQTSFCKTQDTLLESQDDYSMHFKSTQKPLAYIKTSGFCSSLFC